MKDKNELSTPDMFGENRKRGPKPSGKAKTPAQRQREYRQRQADKLALLEQLLQQESGPALSHPPKVDRFED